MRRAKTASGARGSEALARVQRNALNALQAWEQELEDQLEMVRSQIGALGAPAASTTPAAPKRRRKTSKKKAGAKRRRKSVGKRTRKTAKKKTARKKTAKKARRKTSKKAAKKTSRKTAKRKTAKRKTAKRKTAKRKTARKSTKKAASKRRGGGRKKQTMVQAIVQLLKDKGRPLRPVEIAKFIKDEKRYPTKSKNVYNAVMTNLVRSKDVKKNREGLYVLA